MSASWPGIETEALRAADVASVLSGEAGYLRVRGFLDAGARRAALERFFGADLLERDYGNCRTVQVGLPLVAGYGDAYFEKARAANDAVRSLYRGCEDPFSKLKDRLAAATGWTCEDAAEGGRPYCTSMVGAMLPGSALELHCDLPREHCREALSLGRFVARFPRLLAWNVYLSTAESGGELVVYRRGFRSEDGKHIEPCPAVMLDAARASIRPEAGDLVLLDPDLYHEVVRTGGTPRVTEHGLISVDPEGRRAAFWI